MKNTFIMVAAVLLSAISCSMQDEATYNIVPQPQVIKPSGNGQFDFNGAVTIIADENDPQMLRNAGFLAGYVETLLGTRPSVNGEGDGRIILAYAEKADDEAYELSIKENEICVKGGHAGVFYGIQTLRKAISDKGGVLPAATFKDWPAFRYRGAHLDVSRHFFTVEEVKTYLDMMALHNMNVFHWHLTDDQGWRVEISRYPELTAKGSIREKTLAGHVHDGEEKWDEHPYGEGFWYSKAQIQEVIDYAAERYIDIVPEIDLPGHMQAALATYPELGCTGGPYKVWPTWGVSDDVLCAGNPEVYEFLDNVFTEIVEMFPYEYVHIGGDECPKSRWEACPRCRKKIAELGLVTDEKSTAENKLQSHVMAHVVEFLKAKGRKAIGWDEVLEGGVGDDITVMSWRGEEGGIAAAKLGNDVVMTPYSHLYYDYNQCEDYMEREPYGRLGYGVVTLEKAYEYEPLPASLTKEEQKHILGLQANLWTEYVCSFAHAQYQVLPRWAALAENQWTHPSDKDYSRFLTRLSSLLRIYDKEGYNYATVAFE